MKNRRVSVIIPTYNRSVLLIRAIESVLEQSFKPFEVIVVDDGSTDNTQIAVRKYGNLVTYHLADHSGLPAVNRNVGIYLSNGNLIALLDDDDEWLPKKLEIQVAAFDDPEVGLVCSNAFRISSEKEQPSQLYFSSDQGASGDITSVLLKDNFIITSSVLFRRDLINEIGVMNETGLYKAVEDYDYWLRISLKTKVFYLNQPLVLYRDFTSLVSEPTASSRYCYALIDMIQNTRNVDPDFSNKQNQEIEYAISLRRYQLIRALIREGNLISALTAILKFLESGDFLRTIRIRLQR